MRTLFVLCVVALAATSAAAQTLPPVNLAPTVTLGVTPTLAGVWAVQSIYDGRLTLTPGANGEITGQFAEENGAVRTCQGDYRNAGAMLICRGADLAPFIIVVRAESLPPQNTRRARRGIGARLVGRMYIGAAGPPPGLLGEAELEGRLVG